MAMKGRKKLERKKKLAWIHTLQQVDVNIIMEKLKN